MKILILDPEKKVSYRISKDTNIKKIEGADQKRLFMVKI